MSTRRASALRGPIVSAAVAVAVVVLGGVALHASVFDLSAVQALNRVHTGFLAALGDAVYSAIEPPVAIAATIVLTVVIAIVRRELAAASTFAITIAWTWLPSAAIKAIVGRPRPAASALIYPPLAQPDASYPSGHTVFVTTLVTAAVLVATSRVLRRMWLIAGTALVALVAFCVMSDGLHFPTDVLAAIVWAAGVAPLVCIAWQRWVIPRIRPLRPRASRV